MRQINNFEKNRKALKDWMMERGVFSFVLESPVRAEVYYPGNRGEGCVPDVVCCGYVMILPKVCNGRIDRWELKFKDTEGRDICYNDLSDGNFYRDILDGIKKQINLII